MELADARCLKELAKENAELKKVLADLNGITSL